MMENNMNELSNDLRKEKIPLQFPLSKELFERAKQELDAERELEEKNATPKNKPAENQESSYVYTNDSGKNSSRNLGMGSLNLKMKPLFINGWYSPGQRKQI